MRGRDRPTRTRSAEPPTARYDRWMDGAAADCELLDAGDGRRLDRFGRLVLDRPAPVMTGTSPRDPRAWATAAARFERAASGSGTWIPAVVVADPWPVTIGGLRLELRATPSGGVGLFPEHLVVARWAAERTADLRASGAGDPEVLNLFAHTGLATLALAAAGARVVHVDASRPAVAWARRNAELSGLADRPVRWLVDDAGRFAAREVRRGRRYAGALLDPPTYGHGPGGRGWSLAADLPALIADVGRLLADGPWFLAVTAHATGADAASLEAIVRRALGRPLRAETRPLRLRARSGAVLPAGIAVLATGAPEVPGQ